MCDLSATIIKHTKIAIYVMRFGTNKQKCLMAYNKRMTRFNNPFQIGKPFRNRLNRYREIATRTWSKMNTFMRFVPTGPEVDGDVVSGRNGKTIDGLDDVKFEVANSSYFRYIFLRIIISWRRRRTSAIALNAALNHRVSQCRWQIKSRRNYDAHL